ncbi:MAG: ribbon-helix-helix domain-containing protein [Bifidobacteriaceae bacterium]|nr:ribbon-helix-helix domain-containing protein [Bifidobacteriaceae bacterium]
MQKTTIYLTDDLKARVETAALLRGSSEAEVIRDAIDQGVPAVPPEPNVGLYASGDPISERVDELLADGFGLR